jgi:MFS superfamily sulfate permease-like transporter
VPILLVVFLAGFVLIALQTPEVYRSVRFSLPEVRIVWPGGPDWSGGLLKGAIPPLPLTLLNSVLAVCALSRDYFPGRGVSPRRMAASVGLMNVLCVPLGGIPMCHGAGGLAAQYRFGARSGGSDVMLGGLLCFFGLAFGCGLLGLLTAYPRSILAVMLIFSGGMLASAAKDSLRGRDALVLLVTAGLILVFGTLIGFLAGLCLAAILAGGKTGPLQGGKIFGGRVDVGQR